MELLMADGVPAAVGTKVTRFGDEEELDGMWVQFLEWGVIEDVVDHEFVRVRFDQSNDQSAVPNGHTRTCGVECLQSFPIQFEEVVFLELISEVR